MLFLLPLPLTATFWLWEFLGRLHPMMVHFPIALLIAAWGMELLTIGRKRAGLREGIALLLWGGMGFAILSTLFGLILHEQEAYNHELVENHERLGILTTLLSIGALWVHNRWRKKETSRLLLVYRTLLSASVLGLIFAGHFGASLTHGADYLTEVLPSGASPESTGEQEALMAEFASLKSSDSLSTDQLERLNLEVRAIFAHHCYQCHSEEKSKGELVLDSREGVFAGGESGPILEIGNANGSELVRRIGLSKGDDGVMPSKGKLLNKSQIELIRLWIDHGAHWSDQALKIFPEAELALEMPVLPESEQEHPIDQIVDAYFEENGISWEQPVSDRVFLRRTYLDLIGLLPTPTQVQQFEANPSPNKRAALIDTLLADDHAYTQHWLSFWNDLLRNDYSGTGYITGGRKSITDWLYQSLMDNKAYDQMVRELLNPSPESEGFIKGIRWRGVVNSSQSTDMQAAQNVSQSLLGLNLKCASCHNSFVSNLTLDQAYGFASIFADTILEIHRCDKPTGRMAQTKFLYPELGEVDAESLKERLEQLSQVVVQPANGRLYRTLANRLWDRLMGRGIVMPVDEMDQPPWDQDLLDWMAADLIEHEYDLKHTLRTIMTSHAYQLPSVGYRSPMELAGEKYVFRGPVRRRMSAEQLADVLGQTIAPLYHSVAFDPVGERYDAQWIWFRERKVDRDVLPEPGKRYFRHTFMPPNPDFLESAEVLITANHSFTLWINGEKIGEGDDWQAPKRWEVREFIEKGPNVIAVEGENEGTIPNPAGLLFSLKLVWQNGETEYISSSTDWKTTNEPPEENWTDERFDDSEWQKPKRYGGWYNKDWGRIIDFQHTGDGEQLPQARASLVQLDPFLKALGRPTRENVTTRRSDEATLLQALTLTNGEFFNQALAEGAEKLRTQYSEPDALVSAVYQHSLGRDASTREIQKATQFLGDTPGKERIQDLLWAVVLLPEFQLIY